MDRITGQTGTMTDPLYAGCEPFAQHMMDVGDGHTIYVEECGTATGRPVIVLHGGPGGGCSPYMRRFFDPSHYRVVLFDQRGCGRSRPAASVEANMTDHLIADIEKIRVTLGLGRAFLFGGSWGATLALAYAEAHPQRVEGLILRGVFLGQKSELDWFYGGGAGRFYPDLWERFCALIPEDERGDLIAAYHHRLFSDDVQQQQRYAVPWLLWENALASMQGGHFQTAPTEFARVFARLENHYFSNRCFLDEGQLLRDRHRIEHLPAAIVQGRYDMVCPPLSAYRLAQGWEEARLHLVQTAGHALSEQGISSKLVQIMNNLRHDDWG